jgi:hypothetical protein
MGFTGGVPAPSGPTLVNSAEFESTATEEIIPVTLPFVPVSGNLVVGCFIGGGLIEDVEGFTEAVTTGDFVGAAIWSSTNAPTEFDVTQSGDAGYCMGFMEWSGNAAVPLDSAVNDTSNPGAGQSSIELTSPGDTAQAIELVVALCGFLTTAGDREVTGWSGTFTRQFQNLLGVGSGGANDPRMDAGWYLTSGIETPSRTASINPSARPSGVLTAFKF